MIGVLIMTHSILGSALMESSKMILGEDIRKCFAHTLTLGEDIEEFEERFCELLDLLDDGDGVLVMTDLFAGTPANVAMRSMRERRFQCISGVNLGMVLEVLTVRDGQSLEEVKNAALQAAKDSVVDVSGRVRGGTA